jgi:hypothetical protein
MFAFDALEAASIRPPILNKSDRVRQTIHHDDGSVSAASISKSTLLNGTIYIYSAFNR